jgi:hypothetical protein
VQVEFKTLVRELHRNGIEVWQAGSCSKLVCRCETALLVLVQGLYELILYLYYYIWSYLIIYDYSYIGIIILIMFFLIIIHIILILLPND